MCDNTHIYVQLWRADEDTGFPNWPLTKLCPWGRVFFFHTSAFIVNNSWDTCSNGKKLIIYKSRDLVKLHGRYPWGLICRYQSRAGGRGLQSPWRVTPPRRWGALCKCHVCTWWRLPHNKEPGVDEHTNGQKYYSQVWEDSHVDQAVVPTHGLELHFAPHTIQA